MQRSRWITQLGSTLCLAANAAGAEPRLTIVEAPPSCCAGIWAGTITGTASGIDPASTSVVVYAETDLLYVQPYEEARIEIGPSGTWRTPTHGGSRYVALLVRSTYRPEATCNTVPAVGGDILAVASAPDDQRRLEFAGTTWIVKSSGQVPFGPGPLPWSDDDEHVWLDAAGRLHLRLAPQDGAWYGAEVFTAEPRGYGQVRFEFASRLDGLDPNVVAAGFLYADGGAEMDVEFARWGDALNPQPAQFALQPDRVHGFEWEQHSDASLHSIAWMPGMVRCTSREGTLDAPGPAQAEHRWTTGVPVPAGERLHFNLWLHGGQPPLDGLPVELVIADVAFEAVNASDAMVAIAPRFEVVTPAALPLRGWMAFPTAGRVAMLLFDVRGRRVAQQELEHASTQQFIWDPGPLPAGVYWLRLHTEGTAIARRVVLPAARR
jgi:hypothetical protein